MLEILGWMVNLFVPPIITKLSDFLYYGNNSITGKWIQICYDDSYEIERRYAIKEIKRKGNDFTIKGKGYFTEKTQAGGFFIPQEEFSSDFCRYDEQKLEYVSQSGNMTDITKAYVTLDFDKFSRNSPVTYTGYYITHRQNKIRRVRGMKVTKALRRTHKITSNEDALSALVPLIQNSYSEN